MSITVNQLRLFGALDLKPTTAFVPLSAGKRFANSGGMSRQILVNAPLWRRFFWQNLHSIFLSSGRATVELILFLGLLTGASRTACCNCCFVFGLVERKRVYSL